MIVMPRLKEFGSIIGITLSLLHPAITARVFEIKTSQIFFISSPLNLSQLRRNGKLGKEIIDIGKYKCKI